MSGDNVFDLTHGSGFGQASDTAPFIVVLPDLLPLHLQVVRSSPSNAMATRLYGRLELRG